MLQFILAQDCDPLEAQLFCNTRAAECSFWGFPEWLPHGVVATGDLLWQRSPNLAQDHVYHAFGNVRLDRIVARTQQQYLYAEDTVAAEQQQQPPASRHMCGLPRVLCSRGHLPWPTVCIEEGWRARQRLLPSP